MYHNASIHWMDSVVCSPNYHSQGRQGSSLPSTLVLIISQNEVSLKSCYCKMYSPPCKGIRISAFLIFSFRIQNPGKFFLWNPESHYWLKSRKLVLPTKTCTVHGAGTHGVGSRIQQCLGFHYVGPQRHHTGSPNTKNFAKRKSRKQNKLIWQTTHLMHHGS